MDLEYVPLLKLHRELHAIPRGPARFQEYLRILQAGAGGDVRYPPLVLVNPMAKDHVAAILDALLALDADGLAARAVAEAAPRVADAPGDFRVAVVVADDAQGGWTNRHATEFHLRFDGEAARKRGWLSAVLWSSEPPTAEAVREAVLAAVHRAAHRARHGPARTLRERLAQEGRVLREAGCRGPVLDEDDLAYTREVLAPLLDSDDLRTSLECLFGDDAARALGFTPRGLTARAGLALALADARREDAGVATPG